MKPVDPTIVRDVLRATSPNGLTGAQGRALRRLRTFTWLTEKPKNTRRATLDALHRLGLVARATRLRGRIASQVYMLKPQARELLRFLDGAPLGPEPDTKGTTIMTTTKKTTPALSETHRAALKAFEAAGATKARPTGVHHATPKALISAGLLGQRKNGVYSVTAKGKKALATFPVTPLTPVKTKVTKRAPKVAKKPTAKKLARKTGTKAKVSA